MGVVSKKRYYRSKKLINEQEMARKGCEKVV